MKGMIDTLKKTDWSINVLILIWVIAFSLKLCSTLDAFYSQGNVIFIVSLFVISKLMWADMLEFRNKYFRAIIAFLMGCTVVWFLSQILYVLINH